MNINVFTYRKRVEKLGHEIEGNRKTSKSKNRKWESPSRFAPPPVFTWGQGEGVHEKLHEQI